MGKIPPPPKKLPEKEDPSYRFLLIWKKDFEDLYKGAFSVYIKQDDPDFFQNLFKVFIYPKAPHGIGHRYNYGNAELFVFLPDFCELKFLVGLQYNKMYSDREILSDPLVIEGFDADCEPETKTWKAFYNEVRKKCNIHKDRIPPPLQPPREDY